MSATPPNGDTSFSGHTLASSLAGGQAGELQAGRFHAELREIGYELASIGNLVAGRLVDVWRIKPEFEDEIRAKRRVYLAVAKDEEGERMLNISNHVPTVQDIATSLLAHSLIKELPAPSYEWALNVNDENPSPSNYSCEELRDLAVDELLKSDALDDEDSIVLFEIHPDGRQEDSEHVDITQWASERGLNLSRSSGIERAQGDFALAKSKA
jgi:hypothetical protein